MRNLRRAGSFGGLFSFEHLERQGKQFRFASVSWLHVRGRAIVRLWDREFVAGRSEGGFLLDKSRATLCWHNAPISP